MVFSSHGQKNTCQNLHLYGSYYCPLAKARGNTERYSENLARGFSRGSKSRASLSILAWFLTFHTIQVKP